MGNKLSRLAVVAAKIESVEGTAETLAAADANFLVMEPSFEADIPMFERGNLNASQSAYAMIPGTQAARLRFKVEAKNSGISTTAPALGKLIQACGFSQATSSSGTVFYPINVNVPSLTIALYTAGNSGSAIRKQIRGARGNFKYTGKNGEPGMFEFEFLGVLDGVTDQTILSGTGIETTIPPALLSANFSLHSFAAFVSTLSIDLGNTLELRPDINQSTGFLSCLITKRMPKGSVDPEQENIATHDFYGRWMNGASTGTLTWVHRGSSGNIVLFGASAVQYIKLTEQDRGGLATYGVDFLLSRSAASGNDELWMLFK